MSSQIDSDVGSPAGFDSSRPLPLPPAVDTANVVREEGMYDDDDEIVTPNHCTTIMLEQRIDATLSDGELVSMINVWHQTWCPRVDSREELYAHLDKLYGPVFTEDALRTRHHRFIHQTVSMKRECLARAICRQDEVVDSSASVAGMLTDIASNMHNAYDIVVRQARLVLSFDPRLTANLPRDETLHAYYQPRGNLPPPRDPDADADADVPMGAVRPPRDETLHSYYQPRNETLPSARADARNWNDYYSDYTRATRRSFGDVHSTPTAVECTICTLEKKDFYSPFTCAHTLCTACAPQLIAMTCPMCRATQ
jgi:hypothetical protein